MGGGAAVPDAELALSQEPSHGEGLLCQCLAPGCLLDEAAPPDPDFHHQPPQRIPGGSPEAPWRGCHKAQGLTPLLPGWPATRATVTGALATAMRGWGARGTFHGPRYRAAEEEPGRTKMSPWTSCAAVREEPGQQHNFGSADEEEVLLQPDQQWGLAVGGWWEECARNRM